MTPVNLNQFSHVLLEEEEQDQSHLPPSTLPPNTFSFACPLFFNTPQDPGATDHREHHHLYQQGEEEANELVWIGGSNEHSRSFQTNKSSNNTHGSVKWMSSKMRLMRKMMSSDQIVGNNPRKNMQEPEDHRQPNHDGTSSSNSNNSACGIIRVCSDCNTTKTPLWRSGPRGPKSLCNACGIRQRKARRAAMAAAAVSGGLIATTDAPSEVQREKRSDGDRTVPYKKRCKFTTCETAKEKLHFDDIVISLSKNSSLHRVFPQDEKDAAILLMALSCGLIYR